MIEIIKSWFKKPKKKYSFTDELLTLKHSDPDKYKKYIEGFNSK